MDMIEQVAKAIYREFENRPDYAKVQMNGVLAEELARAAIEAMKQPTEFMLDIGACYEDQDHDIVEEGHIAEDVWKAMVRAAMNGEKT